MGAEGTGALNGRFEGVFKPPAIGRRVPPIKIAGPGSCTLTREVLLVAGYRPRSLGKRFALFLLIVVGGIIAVAAAATAFGDWIRYLFVAPLIAAVAAFTRGTGDYRTERPITLSIPWSSVHRAEMDPATPGGLLIHVRRYRPKGMLHFFPSDSAQRLLSEIERHVSTARPPSQG